MQSAPNQSGSSGRAVIRFGVFEADLRAGDLRKNGVKVKIQDLPFRALKLLLNHPNEVISRDQFRQSLWPQGVFVDFDHGISSAVNRLRDALGDSADNPIFIETVERRGYRWIAPTQWADPPAPPRLIVVKPEAEKGPEPSHEKPSPPPPTPHRWGWVLILPAIALALAAWFFRPGYRAVSAKVKTTTGAASSSANPAPPAANSEAQQYYLKGRFYWEKRNADSLNKAVDYFTQSIVHDPAYAPAYVGLADCYNLMREYTLMPPSESYPRALAAAKKAVELDDRSSEAHASLAFALFWGNWDAAGADREFRRAIELNPDNSVAHHWYATYLMTAGHHPESVVEIKCAQALDPASKSVLADEGFVLCAAGQCNEGMALLKQLEASDPDFVSPPRYLREITFSAGDYPTFLDEWRKEATLLKDRDTLKLVEAAHKGYASGGKRGMLENMRAAEKQLYERGSESAYSIASIDGLLGHNAEALQFLKVSYDKHDDAMIGVKDDSAFLALHDDPAFKDLLNKVYAQGKD